MQLNPYLSFAGECREALSFYKECLSGEVTMQTIGESPMAASMPAEVQNNILHATVSKDGVVLLMASDMFTQGEMVKGTNITLTLGCASEEEIQSVFAKLAVGGQITTPLRTEFWGATFGQIVDKYGFSWMLNFDKPAS